MRSQLFAISMMILVGSANADYVGTGSTKVTQVSSYNQYGNGHVVFKVENPISACVDGYWLAKDDAGFQANISMIISAHQTKTTVAVFGLPDQLWSGSSGKYCKLYSFELR